MSYQYYNANPQGKIEPDCFIRAISKALDLPYNEVDEKLLEAADELGAEGCNDMNTIFYALRVQFGKKIDVFQPADRDLTAMTPREFAEEVPTGHYLLNMSTHSGGKYEDHSVACVDGVYYDTADCGDSALLHIVEILN